MRSFFYFFCFILSVFCPALLLSASAQEEQGNGVGQYRPLGDEAEEKSWIERGRYLAVASDCAACHSSSEKGSKAYAGGDIFQMPIGAVVSTNITPSQEFGIGAWSEAEFARAVREGVRADGTHLYPIMPYPEYSIITDEDIHALYLYFMHGVAPVDEAPQGETKMHFPFDLIGDMSLWNALFLNYQRFEPDPKLSDELNRGRYLADGPAHCRTCHSPRNFMMALNSNRYLAGTGLMGWWAPNLTSDPVGGLGGWSKEEIVTYLKTGNVHNKSQAGGLMAEAISLSLRHLTDSDLEAIAAYIKTVPPVSTKGQLRPAFALNTPKETSFTQYEIPYAGSSAPSSSASHSLDGAVLYNSACAACHGVNGQGADDGSAPSLLQNRAVGIFNPDSLIMIIAHGLYREGQDKTVSMPGFWHKNNPIAAAMNEEQIAALTSYVRINFGGSSKIVSTAEVKMILAGGKMPFFILHAALLFYFAGIMILAILVLIFYLFWRSCRRKTVKRQQHKFRRPIKAVTRVRTTKNFSRQKPKSGKRNRGKR